MLNLTKIEIVVKDKRGVDTVHTLHVKIHKDILNNENRLISHCRSLARKTYGNKAVIIKITKAESDDV